jgi:hypothetical protein
MSLSNDPHPTVHFWALESLSRVADSAGLTFSGYVSGTLGMLAQLYVADSHNDECASLAASNLETDLPSPAVIARCIDSIINVLGPDLQDMAKARDLIMMLIDRFQREEERLVLIECLKCQEHLSLYAPGHMEFSGYVKRLQMDLDSDSVQIRDMAIDGLHNLMRRNAEEVIRTAEPGLEDQLWLIFNIAPEHEVVRNIIRNWLHQTGLTNTAEWVQRCHTVLTKTIRRPEQVVAPQSNAKALPDLQDEEVAGFAASANAPGDDAGSANQSSQELLKWQVRTFAMDCLSDLLSMISGEAVSQEVSQAALALQQRVADVVRIAFSASTAGVVQLRIRGLKIIDQVLKVGSLQHPVTTILTLSSRFSARLRILISLRHRCLNSIKPKLAQRLRQHSLLTLLLSLLLRLSTSAQRSLPLASSLT